MAAWYLNEGGGEFWMEALSVQFGPGSQGDKSPLDGGASYVIMNKIDAQQ